MPSGSATDFVATRGGGSSGGGFWSFLSSLEGPNDPFRGIDFGASFDAGYARSAGAWAGYPAAIRDLFDPNRTAGPYVATANEISNAYAALAQSRRERAYQTSANIQSAFAPRQTLEPIPSGAFQIQSQPLFGGRGEVAAPKRKFPWLLVGGVALVGGFFIAKKKGWIGAKKGA